MSQVRTQIYVYTFLHRFQNDVQDDDDIIPH